MSLSPYGLEGGEAGDHPVAIYFHGVPGAPIESSRFQCAARDAGVRLIALDRRSVDPSLQGEGYFEALADEVTRLSGGAPVHLIGFSLGAFVAIRTAILVKAPVASLHLISSAAPLDSGDFLGQMAGRAVFRAAQRGPGPLGRMTEVQAKMARWAPRLMFAMLFAGAAGADAPLASDPVFRTEIRDGLRVALANGAAGYVRDLTAYVQPWQDQLAEVSADTAIWHGADDTWAPAAMAVALRDRITPAPQLTVTDGLSHYSCLFHAMPQILSKIGGAPEMTR